MNGSRSNNPGYGSRSSLDQLNRTIEGLEARIQGLVAGRQTHAARPLSPRIDHVDEIIERQRALGSDRHKPQHVPETTTRSDVTGRVNAARKDQFQPQPAYTEPNGQAQALQDIAATLQALRNEIKQEVSGNLAQDLREMRRDIKNVKSVDTSDALRGDLERLHDSIERLAASGRNDDFEMLRGDLEQLREMTAGLARQESLSQLQQRWDRTEEMIGNIDTDSMREELVQLAWRIDGIKSSLGELSAAPAVRALEDKLLALATSVENINRNLGSRQELEGHLSGLDLRLDEISRAIAANARQANSAGDSLAFQRLEQRIADLGFHIDALQGANHDPVLTSHIEALAHKIDAFADEDAASRLEQRLDGLSRLIEKNFTNAPQLADISRKIEDLGGQRSDILIERLDTLAARLDAFERPDSAYSSNSSDSVAFSRLEQRLADIAAKLDETALAPASDQTALQNLERQIASLSTLIGQDYREVATDTQYPNRMAAIEEYIATSDEFIVEAARQAAEAVVDAYSRSSLGGQNMSAQDISVIAGLADDLRALENHTRSSDERTQETFHALHETLQQIAGRLDRLSISPAAERDEKISRPASVPLMPRAAQMEMEPTVSDELHLRQVPKEARVAILQDDELEEREIERSDKSEPVEPIRGNDRTEKAVSKTFLVNLAHRLKPVKKEAPRVEITPTPALDTSDLPAAEEANLLIEPGNGVPDVHKIMEKVRASQRANAQSGRTAPSGPVDVIAAARRAAQAAAEEAGAQNHQSKASKSPSRNSAEKSRSQARSSRFSSSEARRPILLAAGAILLVIMSYPLVSNLIGNSNEDPAATPVIDVPAEEKTSSAEPALDVKPAAEDVGDAQSPLTVQTVDASKTRSIDGLSRATGAEMMMAPATDITVAKPLDPMQTLGTDVKPASTTKVAGEQEKEPVAAAETTPPTAETPVTGVDLLEGLQPAALGDAARKNDPLAFYEIGSRFAEGRNGLKLDPIAAAKWYQRAADQGFAAAEYRLGTIYEKGTGVEPDVEKARKLYLSAAGKGNASAMHNLAVISATGANGENPNLSEAARWFKSAAEMNVRDSQFNLAILYARGNGIEQDLEETYKWFGVAARQGDEDAAKKRDEVANALSAEKLKSAKAKLELWQPKPLDENANNPVVPDAWIAKANTTASIDMKRAIRNIQAILNNNGFDAGEPDGNLGKKTVIAIKAFQKSLGQEQNGKIDEALVRELLKRNKKA